jgi:hypothetical protein
MEISAFLKRWNQGEGRSRIIDDHGSVIRDNYEPYWGVSVDWISAEWAMKKGIELKEESYNPDTFRFFK